MVLYLVLQFISPIPAAGCWLLAVSYTHLLQLDNGKVHFHVFSFAKGASHFQPVGQGVGAQIFAEDDEQQDGKGSPRRPD